MRFWRTAPGGLFLAILVAALVALGTVALRVYGATHPARRLDVAPELTRVVVPVEEVGFSASDGVSLEAWMIQGEPGMPFILLCHDLGENKGSLLDMAILLQKEGFGVLAMDFRGHGRSGGRGSSLGLAEKRDVIGAVDYLASLDEKVARLGVYGVGTGAHAAVLAAVDRPVIKVMVLDGLYPDATFPLLRQVYGDWSFGARRLGFLPKAVFAMLGATRNETERAAEVLPSLVGRDLLLLAPAGDGSLAREMQAMYETIPDQKGADGNLVMLPSTHLQTLYGEELLLYQKRVVSFFRSRMISRGKLTKQ